MGSTSVIETRNYHLNTTETQYADSKTFAKVGMTTANPVIVEGQTSVNSVNGVTPLMQACQQGRDANVRQILHKESRTAFDRDKTGKTALHYCSENTSLSCIEQLINVDPSLMNARDEDGYTPLHLATIAGNKTVAKYLISKGADIHARDNEMHTAVHWATVCGEIELLDMLVDSGADPSTPDIHGAYPIHYAAQMCGPNSELGHEVHIGLQVLQKLLKRGVSVAVKDHDGRQPLLWAASAEVRPSHVYCPSGSADAILALVNAGADVAADDKDGLTALHCAASRGHVDCLDVLISLCSAEVDTLDTNGCTPLFYAATLGHADCTELLLKHGAIPDRQDRKGRTPAHCGAAKGQLETLKMLHRRGADLWKRNIKGDLPLHEACQSGRKDLVMWLLSLQPEAVNAPNNDGRCPLHIAAISNNTEMCKILMDYKASVNPIMRNSRGQLMTPVDAAVARGNRGCAKYLQLHGGLPASKLTDKRALQLAMQRALEAGPIEPTGATPSDLMGDFTSSSTPVAKTPSTTAITPTRLSPNSALQLANNLSQSSIAIQMGPSSFSPPPIDSGSQTDAALGYHEAEKSNSEDIKNIVLREQKLLQKEGKHDGKKKNNIKKAKNTRSKDVGSDGSDGTGGDDDDDVDEEEENDQSDGNDDEQNVHGSVSLQNDDANESNKKIQSKKKTGIKTKSKSLDSDKVSKNSLVHDPNTKEPKKTTTKVVKSKSTDESKTEGSITSTKVDQKRIDKSKENSKEKMSIDNKKGKLKEKNSKDGSVSENESKKVSNKRGTKNITRARSESVGDALEIRNKEKNSIKRANSDSEIHKLIKKTEIIITETESLQDLEETSNKKGKRQSKTKGEKSKKVGKNNKTLSKESSKDNNGIKSEETEVTQKKGLKRKGTYNVKQERTSIEKNESKDSESLSQNNKSNADDDNDNDDEDESENEGQSDDSGEGNSDRSIESSKLTVPKREDGDGASEDGEEVDVSDNSSTSKSTKKKQVKKKRITKKRSTKSATSNSSRSKEAEGISGADRRSSSDASDEESTSESDEDTTEKKPVKGEKRKSRPRTAVRSGSSKNKNYSQKMQQPLNELGENASVNSSDERTHEILLQYSGRETGLVRESPPDDILSPLQANQNLKSLDVADYKQSLQKKKEDERQKRSNEDENNKGESGNEVESESDSADEKGGDMNEVERKERREMRLKRRKAKLQKRAKVTGEKKGDQEAKKDIKRVLSGGPKKVENLESNLRKKVASPPTEMSITRAMQSTMRKYSLERRLFQQLLDLKRMQIRNSRANEHVLIKRMIDEYNKERSYLGLRPYGGPYSFSNYEKYLYDQLRTLQSSQGTKIPQFKKNDDIEKLTRALRKANVPDFTQTTLNRIDDDAKDIFNCNHSTHRCHHAIHAYTGVPCAAYLSQYQKNLKAGRINLPQIPTSPIITIRENNNRKIVTEQGTGGLKNYDAKKPLKVELQHGSAKQQISLPTNFLDKSRKYQLTVSIQPSSKGNKSKVNITSEETQKLKPGESQDVSSARSAPETTISLDTTPLTPKDLHSAPMKMGRTPPFSKAPKLRPQK